MAQATYDFSGRTALITGGGGDIGLAVARRLAASGAALALVDLDEAKLEAAAETLEGRAATFVCDVRDRAAVTAAFSAAEAELGTLDCVFNNAGYQGEFAPSDVYPEDDFRRVTDVNIIGAYNVLSIAASRLKANGGGAIVNTASHAGVDGPPNMLAYGASKAAVIAMTQTAAKDLAPAGIRVNAISPALIGPGFMWTRQCQLQAAAGSQYFSTDASEVEQQMLEKVPLRRLGSLDEVASAVTWLLSEEASYLTGFNLEITGGI